MRRPKSLLDRLKAGDTAAFESLYLDLRDALVRYARRFVSSWQEAQDLVDEAFCALLTHCDQIKDGVPLKLWLYCVVRNRCRNELRRRERENRALGIFAPAARRAPADRSAELIDLERAFDQLRPEDQDLLELQVAGFSSVEIGAICHLTPGAVRKRLHQVRSHLAAELGDTDRKEGSDELHAR